MKVLFLTLTPSPHIEGNLSALAQHPDVDLVAAFETVSQGKRSWGNHFPECEVIDLQSRKLRGMASLYSAKLWKVLVRVEPDAIVIGSSFWSPNSWLARLYARRNGVAFYIFSEAPFSTRSKPFQWLRRQVGKLFFSKCAGFLGVTRGVCNDIEAAYKHASPSLVFPYHRDLSPFTPPIDTGQQSAPLRLLFVGALDDRKNVRLLLQALRSVEEPYHLDIIGEGDQKAFLQDLANDACPGKVIFHGQVSYDEVPSHMRRANYLVLPSKHDGFGMVVVEALTIGLPVIASDGVRSAVEYITNDENGWVFKNNDQQDLQTKLTQALRNPQDWEAQSRSAAQITRAYNVQKTVSDFVDLLKKGQTSGSTP